METNNNITQEFLETVEKYVNNSMSHEELTAFENKLKNDQEFKTKVNDIKALLLGIDEVGMKTSVEEFHKTVKEKPQRRTSLFRFNRVAIAAILVIGLAMTWFLMPSANDKIYNTYFSPDPGLPTVMSSTNNYEFYNAMVHYKQGKYDNAIEQWHKLYLNKPNNDTLNYFLGIAHLANKNSVLAEKFLKTTTNNQNSVFINDAQFYLGLIALKNNDNAKAKSYFKQSNHSKSKEVINQLE